MFKKFLARLKLLKQIPKGPYCYGEFTCPFRIYLQDEGIEIPYCSYLEDGDITCISDTAFEILEKKYGMEVWNKYSLPFLAQGLKECGEKNDDRLMSKLYEQLY